MNVATCAAASSQRINLPNLSKNTFRPTPLKCGIRRDSKDETRFPSPTGVAGHHRKSNPEFNHDTNLAQGQYKSCPGVSIVAASSSSNTQEMTEYKSTDVLYDKGSRSTFSPTASGINSGINLSNMKSSGGISALCTRGSMTLGDITVSNGMLYVRYVACLHMHTCVCMSGACMWH